MIHTITLLILGALIIANLVVLINISNNPMYNAMDNYNKSTDDVDELTNNQLSESLYGVRIVVEDMQERLTILEESFKYHIQSTGEFKSK